MDKEPLEKRLELRDKTNSALAEAVGSLFKSLTNLLEKSPKKVELLQEMYSKSKQDPRTALVCLIEDLTGKPLTQKVAEFLEHVECYRFCQVLAPSLYAAENREMESVVSLSGVQTLGVQGMGEPNVQIMGRLKNPSLGDGVVSEMVESVGKGAAGKTPDEIRAETERVLNDPWCGLPRLKVGVPDSEQPPVILSRCSLALLKQAEGFPEDSPFSDQFPADVIDLADSLPESPSAMKSAVGKVIPQGPILQGYPAGLVNLAAVALEGGPVAGKALLSTDNALVPEQRIEKVIKELGIELTPEQREHFESLPDVDAALYLVELARKVEPTTATRDLARQKKPLNEVEHAIQGWKKDLPKKE